MIGIYRTYAQAERAKDVEVDGTETNDGGPYHCGTDFITYFQIFEENVLGSDEEESNDGDY